MQPESRETPRFTTPAGPIEGWIDGAVRRATGIPYATALRGEEPIAVEDREELLFATEWAPACPQNPAPLLEERLGYRPDELHYDEDCLRLSVTMPGEDSDEPLPVLVWIHGGSYVSGAGDIGFMDPAPLVADAQVIVVTVTYRLGALGYVGGGSRPANLGVLDQWLAFEWVKRNIAAFGGDPENVTAFGESAGADAVLHLMAIPGAPKLMKRAIVQSAPLGSLTADRPKMHEQMVPTLAGVNEHMPIDEVLALEKVAAKAAAGFGLSSAMPYGPQPGVAPFEPGVGLTEALSRVAPEIELMIGHTKEEARFFLESIPALAKLGSVPLVGGALQGLAARALTKSAYAKPARELAATMRAAGGRVSRFVVTWSAPGNPFGACHTVDLAMLFGDERAWRDATLVRGASWAEIEQSGRIVRRAWGAFARGRHPEPHDGAAGVIRFERA